MPKRQIVLSPKYNVEKYKQQCSNQVEGFSEGWGDFYNILVNRAESGRKNNTEHGAYYSLSKNYALPGIKMPFSISAIYVMNDTRVLITRLEVIVLKA